MKSPLVRILAILIAFATVSVGFAQSPDEAAHKAASHFKIVHPRIVPREELLKLKVQVKPEMLGKHPRTLWTREEAREYWKNYSGMSEKDMKARGAYYLDRIGGALKKGKATHGQDVLSAAHLNEYLQNPDLDRVLIDWMLLVCGQETWGGKTGWRANYDLPAAYNFTGIAGAYDSLRDKMTEEERKLVCDKVRTQSLVGFEHDRLDVKRGRAFTYDQNHHFLPVASLGLAAFTFYDEIDEAPRWADMARRSMDRTMAFYSPDGFSFEGPLYWSWTGAYVMRYIYALERMTGETLAPEGVGDFKYYLAQTSLPPAGKRRSAFHFGDANQKFVKLNSRITHYHDRPIYLNYSWLKFWAPRLGDPQMLGVVEFWSPGSDTPWLPDKVGAITGMPWLPESVRGIMKAEPIQTMPTWHYFPDMEVVTWRTAWKGAPLCVVFKCGPPEGHEFLKLYNAMDDSRFNFGHAHPDAGTFQIDAGGQLLATGPGYIKSKQARYENTLLVDGRGQRNDEQYHTWRARGDFKAVPYADYDPIRMEEVGMSALGAYGRGQLAAAYYTDLEIESARRYFFATGPAAEGGYGHILVYDEVDSAKPHDYTFMLHTVREMTEEGPRTWLATSRDMAMRIQALGEAAVRGEVAPTVLEPYHAPPTMPAKSDPKLDRRAEHVAITTVDKGKHGEMLTSLLPVSADKPDDAPKVAPLGDKTVRGAAIEHADGTRETKLIALSGKWKAGDARGEGAAVWFVEKPEGRWTRLTAARATALSGGGVVVAADGPVDISLWRGEDGAWAGEVRATQETELRLTVPDGQVRIAGAKAAGENTWKLSADRYQIGK